MPEDDESLGTILLVIPTFPAPNDVRAVPDLPNHPKPLGPYSHCVVANGFVFISAQAPIAPGAKAGDWAAPDIAGQTKQSLTNIASILGELGLTMASVVKTTVFLSDPADFQAMNEAYKEFFPDEPPARSPSKLGIANPGLKVAIEAIAVYESKQDE